MNPCVCLFVSKQNGNKARDIKLVSKEGALKYDINKTQDLWFKSVQW